MTGHNINLPLQTGLDTYDFTGTVTVPNGKALTLQTAVDIDGNGRAWPTVTRPDLGADEIAPGRCFVFMPGVLC